MARSSSRVRYRIACKTLVLDLGAPYRVLSSAPHGGGLLLARSILNHQVAANPVQRPHRAGSQRSWGDPSRVLGDLARRLKAPSPTVGLMTAVPMTQLVVVRETQGDISLECFCTVGVTNAVSAGEPADHLGRGKATDKVGTINIILITNATLSGSAMVGVVQVATESKTAVLRENRVRSAASDRLATGTGTDAVVVASARTKSVQLAYSGTHTVLGGMVGRAVAKAIQEGLNRSKRWHQRRGHESADK